MMDIKLCRICGKQEENLIHIFKTEGLKNKIETCLPIIVTVDCPLPNTICTACLDSVDNFYSFIKNCLQNIIVLESQYDINESCLKTKRKVDRSVSVDSCDLTAASLLIKYENLDHRDDVTVKKETSALVDYDLSSSSETEEDNDNSLQQHSARKHLFNKTKNIIHNRSNDIITEIVERKYLKRKNDEDIVPDLSKKLKKDESTTINQTNFNDSSSRRKNSRPKRVEYHLESKTLIKEEEEEQQQQQQKHEIETIPVVPSIFQQQTMQMCLLCEEQLPGLLALAAHMYETHGIDVSNIYASDSASATSTTTATTMPINLSLNNLNQCERILEPQQQLIMPQMNLTMSQNQNIHLGGCKTRKIPELVKISDVLITNRRMNTKNELLYRQQQQQAQQFGDEQQLPVPVLQMQMNKQNISNNKQQQQNFNDQQGFICSECPINRQRPFTSYPEFSTHRRAQHQIFHCDLCPKFYGRNSHLWKHVNRVHKGHTAITCHECGKTSASEYHLAQHRNKMHSSTMVTAKSTKTQHKSQQQQQQQQQQQKRKYNKTKITASSITSNKALKLNERVENKIRENNSKQIIKCDNVKIEMNKDESNESDFSSLIKNEIEDEDDLLNQKFQGFDFKSVRQSFLKQELMSKQQRLVSVLKTNNHLQLVEKTDIDTKSSSSSKKTELKSQSTASSSSSSSSLIGAPKEIDASSDLYTTIITNYTPPTNEGPYKCPKCFKGFHKKNLLKKHKKNCRPRLQKDLLTRCKTCSRIFKDRQSLAKHLVNYHSEYTCEICNVAVQSKCEIVSHIRFTHPHSELECYCGQILRSKADLIRHKADHRDSHVCQFCGDSLPTKIKLKMHILSLHRKILALSCGICLRLFESQHVLRAHVRHAHADQLRPLTSCTVCGKNYGSKWKTYDHLNKSHGRIFRACKACLEVFENEKELQQHFERYHINNSNNNITSSVTATAIATAISSTATTTTTTTTSTITNNSIKSNNLLNIKKEKNIKRLAATHVPKLESENETIDDYDENNGDEDNINGEDDYDETYLPSQQQYNDEEPNDDYKSYIVNAKQLKTSSLTNKQNGLSKNSNNKLSLLEKRLLGKKVTTRTTPIKIHEEEQIINNNKKESNNILEISNNNGNNDDILQNSSKRTVYVNSNDPSLCEICLKVWPAKKHLWQHYIRCHKQTAATVCGICLKTNPTYADLQRHLRTTHPRLLHGCGFGSNFICKICGRYHNASSKLRLHMAIHVGYTKTDEHEEDNNDDALQSEENINNTNSENKVNIQKENKPVASTSSTTINKKISNNNDDGDDDDDDDDDEDDDEDADNDDDDDDDDDHNNKIKLKQTIATTSVESDEENQNAGDADNNDNEVEDGDGDDDEDEDDDDDDDDDDGGNDNEDADDHDDDENEKGQPNDDDDNNEKNDDYEKQIEIKQEIEEVDNEIYESDEACESSRSSNNSINHCEEQQQQQQIVKKEVELITDGYENIINYESLIEEVEASDDDNNHNNDEEDDGDEDEGGDGDGDDVDDDDEDEADDEEDSSRENIDNEDTTTENELEQEMLKNMIGESRTVKLSRLKLEQSEEEMENNDDEEEEEDDDIDDENNLKTPADITTYEVALIDGDDQIIDDDDDDDDCIEFIKNEIDNEEQAEQGQFLINNELDSAIRSICDDDDLDIDETDELDETIPNEIGVTSSGQEVYRRLVVSGGRVNESELETAVGSIL